MTREPDDRAAALRQLILVDAPWPTIQSDLALFPWDSEPVVLLSRSDVARVLAQFLEGTVSAELLGKWADALECREDVDFADPVVGAAIHALANPELAGPISHETVSHLIKTCL